VTTISRPAQQNAYVAPKQTQQTDALTRGLIKAADVAIKNLDKALSQLQNLEGALSQCRAGLPPSELKAGANPFAAMAQIPPGAAMAGGTAPVSAYIDSNDMAMTRAEIRANIEETYGPGASKLADRADATIAAGQTALAAALQGADHKQLVEILGKNNPHSAGLAVRIQEVAQRLTQTPFSAQELERAVMRAEYGMLHHATQGDKEGRAQLKHLFSQEYGIVSPDNPRPYTGQGVFGNQAAQMGVGNNPVTLPPGGAPNSRALAMAQSQVGIREASGNNDGIPAQRYSNGRREPWCANFVAWTFRESGNPLPGNQRSLASVQYMEDQMKKAGRFHTGTPQPGDVIFFKNRGDSDSGPGRHVGIVEKVENGRIYTIEGNSGNQVARRSYPIGHPRVAGFGR
jgi:hypothetical protein